MKIENNITEDIEILGDISSNKVSIDTNNLDFIITILSSNLYSKPVDSFIRETVSNAWDSHIEAGTDLPVIINIGSDANGKFYYEIQDYGVGISPERFDKIYRNIGSSTKRDSNEMIGGFGIGRFSALAVSDTVYITSCYEGKEYSYLMYKNGNSISIDLLNVTDTTKRNGVCIRVYINESKHTVTSWVIKTVSNLEFFENVYINLEFLDKEVFEDSTRYSYYSFKNFQELYNFVETFNNSKIKHYNNFVLNHSRIILPTMISNYYGDFYESKLVFCLGKVSYSFDFVNLLNSLNLSESSFRKKYHLLHSMIGGIKFEIGDLDITPNREQILFSTKSINKIKEKFKACQEELEEIVYKDTNTDFNNFYDYVVSLDNKFTITFIEDKNHPYNVTFKRDESLLSNSTLNGKKYDIQSVLDVYNMMKGMEVVPVSCVYDSTSFSLYKNSTKITEISIGCSEINLFNENNKSRLFIYRLDYKDNISSLLKDYIKSTYFNPENNQLYFLKNIISPRQIVKDFFKKMSKTFGKKCKENDFKNVLKVFIKDYLNVYYKNIPVISEKDIPEEYIEQRKEERKLARLNKQTKKCSKDTFNIRELRYHTYNNTEITFDNTPSNIESIKKYKEGLYIFAENDNSKIKELALETLRLKDKVKGNLKLFTVPKSKLNDLKNLNLHNLIYIDDFMNPKHRLFRDIATAYYIQKEYPILKDFANIDNLNVFSKSLYEDVQTLDKFVKDLLGFRKYYSTSSNKLYEEMLEIAEKHNYFNFDKRALFHSVKRRLLKVEFLLKFKNNGIYSNNKIPDEQIAILRDYIICRKLLKVDIN